MEMLLNHLFCVTITKLLEEIWNKGPGGDARPDGLELSILGSGISITVDQGHEDEVKEE